MVKDILTDGMIDAGAAVLRKLDELGLDVRSALWLYDAEIEEWRLLFITPEVGIERPLKVYEIIERALDELGDEGKDAPFMMMQVMDVNRLFARGIKGGIRVDPEGKGFAYAEGRSTTSTSMTRCSIARRNRGRDLFGAGVAARSVHGRSSPRSPRALRRVRLTC